MPELPEVETVRSVLSRHLIGQRLQTVQLRHSGLRRTFQKGLSDDLTGARVNAIDRIGKYLLLRLDGGATLLIHLGMSGKIRIDHPRHGQPHQPKPHDHVVIALTSGAVMAYNDPRRFGMLELIAGEAALQAHPSLSRLGPEPTSANFDGSVLAAALSRTSSALKLALLNQHIVAGLGNIYVCEALHLAGVSPFVSAKEWLKREKPSERAAVLAAAIVKTIQAAIQAGGSTLRDYATPEQESGYFQHQFRVYGRAGEQCPACERAEVEVVRQGGRSTFYCPRCQQ